MHGFRGNEVSLQVKSTSTMDKYYADLHAVNLQLDRLEHSVVAIDKSYADFSATGHSTNSRESEKRTEG